MLDGHEDLSRGQRIVGSSWQEGRALVKRELAEFALFTVAIGQNGGRAPQAPSTAASDDEIRALLAEADKKQVIPLFDHAGAEASIWSRQRSVDCSNLPSPTTGRKPRRAETTDWANLQRALLDALHRWADAGASGAALAFDDDSFFAHALSPRHNPGGEHLRNLDRLCALVEEATIRVPKVGIALTVEELCPGGLDPHDGVEAAQALESAGAAFFVGAGGTRAFPALWRRKERGGESKAGGVPNTLVPALQSAAWLVGKVSVPVWGLAAMKHPSTDLATATAMGLQGIVAPHLSAIMETPMTTAQNPSD
jgi:hypothetical protein